MVKIRLKTSATQIDKFLTCKRTWVASYLLGWQQPQTEAMAFGETGHKYLEIYQKTGKVPDVDRPWQFTKESRIRYPGLSAKKALKHIPAPGKGRPEHGFEFTIKGIKFIGYIDLEWKDENGIWVTDYKFVSSYSSALKEDTLAANIQATIYALKTIFEYNIDEVNLKWIYILSTKNPSSRPIISKLTEKQAKKQFKTLLNICEEMTEFRNNLYNKHNIKELKTLSEEIKLEIINSIQPNVKSCGRYNGCYYLDKCKLTDEQLIEGDMQMSTLEDQLKDLGLDKFIEKPEQEKPEQLNLDEYVTKPEVHEKSTERKEPETKLNAPEHYIELAPCRPAPPRLAPLSKVMITEKERETFLTVIRKLLERI